MLNGGWFWAQDEEYEVHYEWNDVKLMKGDVSSMLDKISRVLAYPDFAPDVLFMSERMIVEIPDLNIMV